MQRLRVCAGISRSNSVVQPCSVVQVNDREFMDVKIFQLAIAGKGEEKTKLTYLLGL